MIPRARRPFEGAEMQEELIYHIEVLGAVIKADYKIPEEEFSKLTKLLRGAN